MGVATGILTSMFWLPTAFFFKSDYLSPTIFMYPGTRFRHEPKKINIAKAQ